MAGMVNRASSSAAANLLGLGELTPARRAPLARSGPRGAGLIGSVSSGPTDAGGFRSAYRVVGDELRLLDQRVIPERLEDLVARRGSDVAYYLRLGACRGGALMAQVAAYGLALTAAERVGQPPGARNAELRRTQRALAEARLSSRLPAWAMERLEATRAALGESADGADVAAALRAEADAIAAAFQLGNAAIAAALAELLAEVEERPLGVLVHGDPGALSGGLVGTAITALADLNAQGRELRVFVTETRPFMDGARLASWELRQAGIRHHIIADSAVAWLFEREAIDAVLMGAEWIAANGDSAAVVGSRAIAQLAAAVTPAPRVPAAPAEAHQEVAAAAEATREVAFSTGATRQARPRVIVCALSDTIDPATPDGSAIPVELRPARDMAAYLAGFSIHITDALVPAADVIPASAIHALVTERGVLAPPSGEGIAALLEMAPEGSV